MSGTLKENRAAREGIRLSTPTINNRAAVGLGFQSGGRVITTGTQSELCSFDFLCCLDPKHTDYMFIIAPVKQSNHNYPNETKSASLTPFSKK